MRSQQVSSETFLGSGFFANEIFKLNYVDIDGNNIQQSKSYPWIQVAKKKCPKILRFYPEDQHSQDYQQEVFLMQTMWKDSQEHNKYTLYKSKKQIKNIQKFEETNKTSSLPTVSQANNDNASKYKIQAVKQFFSDIKSKISDKKQEIAEKFVERQFQQGRSHLKILSQLKVGTSEVGGIRNFCTNNICHKCKRSSDMYVTITAESILMSQKGFIADEIEECIPFTDSLKVQYKLEDLVHFKYTASIESGKTFYRIIFDDFHDMLKFGCVFQEATSKSPYFKPNLYRSFSPKRENCWGKFYCDGQGYFSDLHDEIQKAKYKICMTGWCITPYFLLKRPQSIEKGESRLDRTLERAAKRGVKIFILVFQQPSLIVNNDSYNVYKIFEEMDQNFKVIRHPGIIIPQMWSHHEKSVIIDEQVAFMGGLDICYGRWDNQHHSISDIQGMWQGADYNNERLRSITEPRNYTTSNLDRDSEPRMGWHDIALQVKGQSVTDLQRHFTQYWYFAIRDLSDDPKDHLVNFKNRYQELKRQNYDKQQLMKKQKLSKQQLAEVQLQMLKQAKSGTNKRDYDFSDRIKSATQAFKDLMQKRTHSTDKQLYIEGTSTNTKPGRLQMNLCRSSSSWSTGIKHDEQSIQNAYYNLIDNSKELIYIENQFFMSHQNLIAEKIAERIRKAYIDKSQFKVIVVMPLLPGFQGDIASEKSGVLRVQMHLQYEAIKRHQSSIYRILKKDAPEINLQDYIYFFGLRGHGMFGKGQSKVPKTQIIYVHSKLMIVDDQHMIIGSANINDRSLIGSRDSQLAMVISDPKGSIGKGQIYNFRSTVFQEHFGMQANQTKNMHIYWDQLKNISRKNTQIFREVFGCIPDNTATKFQHIKQLQFKATPRLYEERVGRLIGHYCDFPCDFLKEEDLSLKFGQTQFIMPTIMFT